MTQPHDQTPYGYEPPTRTRSENPIYGHAPQPQPVVVNVVQNAYGAGPVVVRRRLNHQLHFWLTVLTGGGWGLFVWLPLAMRRRKVTVYR